MKKQLHIENLTIKVKLCSSKAVYRNAFSQITISLIAIDEAHCIFFGT
jgi:superfamily II DNA helicase RecQ